MFPPTISIYCSVIKFILITATFLSVIQAYNLNINKAKVFNHPHKYKLYRNSYFGFTVALYSGINYKDQAVFVGALRVNTSQTLVNEPGIVYKCSLNGNCNEWSLDNIVGESYELGIIIRNNSRLGTNISNENKENPRVVVCAPRWKIKWNSEWYMHGICYYTEINANQTFPTSIRRIMSFTNRYQQTARDSKNQGYYKHGIGLLEFSLHTFLYGEQWGGLLGGLGAHSSLGTKIVKSRDKLKFRSIKLGIDEIANEYLGYSVTSTNFDNDHIQFLAGAPHSIDMKGRVRIFLYNPYIKVTHIIDSLNGMQFGEYFGSSLTSCDVDNDGKDEIIVGAPLWTNKGDEGSIRIFTKKNSAKYKLSLQINGEVKDARFGTSIVCLGDIDRDGYKDIAVGAPYENDHGAVYIFNGNEHGLLTSWSQRISGNDFSHNLRGFGISISQPRDIDGNGYFDIAIGSHLSEHAVVLQSQPVVLVNIQIDTKYTKLSNNTSFLVRVCGSYTGVRAPKSLDTIIKLRVDTVYERAYIENLKREDRIYHLPSKLICAEKTCQYINVHLKERNQNMIDPIEISASLILQPKLYSTSVQSTNFFFESPIINKYKSKVKDNITVAFAVDCGIDNICNSNITLNVMTNLANQSHFVVGSQESIKLFIDVHNYGEAAYQAQTHILIPEYMALMNIPINCEPTWNKGPSEIVCNAGNPLINENKLTIEVNIKPMKNIVNSAEILICVTTQSNNLNINHNTKNLTIYLDYDVDISISGHAYDSSYSRLDNDGKHKLDIIQFQHIYKIQKFGITPIMQTNLILLIPTHIIDNKTKNKIEIARVNQTNIVMRELNNDQNSYCNLAESSRIRSTLTFEKINNNVNNNILYINCTNPLIMCATIICVFKSSYNSLTIGEVTITMELQLKNFTDTAMNGTNIIYFASYGYANITSPTGIFMKLGHKPDYIEVRTMINSSIAITTFYVPIWTIVLSAFLGILLLALLTFGLIKLGFFRRKKREELEILKSNKNKQNNFILETTSSREMRDQD